MYESCKLEIFRSLWGVTGTWQQIMDETQQAGFEGIEARMPSGDETCHTLASLLHDHRMPYIGILFTSALVLPRQADTPQDHLTDLSHQLDRMATLAPRFVNVLAGNDRWPLAQQVDFLGRALEIAANTGLKCVFETHRARLFGNPWMTLELIRQLPDLRFTSDISHWIVSCERLLNGPLDDLTTFIARVHHIQARVGYDQGPQVPHPAAPEYAETLAFHQRHWEAIWQSQLDRGQSVTTMTPEFGVDGYLHHLPFTDVPIADVNQLNSWMAQCERQHFDHWIQTSSIHKERTYE